MHQEERRGAGGRRRGRRAADAAVAAAAVADQEAVRPDVRPRGRGPLRLGRRGRHQEPLPQPEPAVRRVPTGAARGRRLRRRQVPTVRPGRRAAQGVRRGPGERRVRAVPDGLVPQRPGRVAQVRQVQQVPVHAEPGGRGQRQVQPDGAVLGRGRRVVHTQPPAGGLRDEDTGGRADRGQVRVAG